MPLIDDLHQDHRQISMLLTILKNKLVTLENGARPNFTLMSEVVDYLSEYAGAAHHERENHLYHYFVEAQPAKAGPVRQSLREHSELAELTNELAGATATAMMDTPFPVEDFRRLLARFIARQEDHLNHEESRVFPLLQQHLSADDWQALQQRLPDPGRDPLSDPETQRRYTQLTQDLIDDLA